MEWLADNWIWLLLIGGFGAMHLFGHGGHDKSAGGGKRTPGGNKDRAV